MTPTWAVPGSYSTTGTLTIFNIKCCWHVKLIFKDVIFDTGNLRNINCWSKLCRIITGLQDVDYAFQFQALHFFYGCGAFLAPMLARPFLQKDTCTNTYGKYGSHGKYGMNMNNKWKSNFDETRISSAFWIYAGIQVRIIDIRGHEMQKGDQKLVCINCFLLPSGFYL